MCLGITAQRVVGGYSNTAVCPSIHVSFFDLVNMIETKPLCASSSSLADIISMTRG